MNNAISDSNEQPQDAQTVEVNGEMVSIEEIKNSYMRQSDYTRKTQELAQERKELEALRAQQLQAEGGSGDAGDDELQRAVKVLKDNGFVTKQELENENRMKNLFKTVPELKSQRKAIEELARVHGKAPEDVVHEYGFMDRAKLEEAKSRMDVVGSPSPMAKSESVSILGANSKQFAQWKAVNVKDGDGMWS